MKGKKNMYVLQHFYDVLNDNKICINPNTSIDVDLTKNEYCQIINWKFFEKDTFNKFVATDNKLIYYQFDRKGYWIKSMDLNVIVSDLVNFGEIFLFSLYDNIYQCCDIVNNKFSFRRLINDYLCLYNEANGNKEFEDFCHAQYLLYQLE